MLDCSKSLDHLGSLLTFGKLISPFTTKEYPYDRRCVQEILEDDLCVAIMIVFWWILNCTDSNFVIHELDSTSNAALWESGHRFFVGEREIGFFCY